MNKAGGDHWARQTEVHPKEENCPESQPSSSPFRLLAPPQPLHGHLCQEVPSGQAFGQKVGNAFPTPFPCPSPVQTGGGGKEWGPGPTSEEVAKAQGED